MPSTVLRIQDEWDKAHGNYSLVDKQKKQTSKKPYYKSFKSARKKKQNFVTENSQRWMYMRVIKEKPLKK